MKKKSIFSKKILKTAAVGLGALGAFVIGKKFIDHGHGHGHCHGHGHGNGNGNCQ